VFGAQPWDHLTAPEDDGVRMGPQVGAVLVEVEGVALQATPALLPALADQDAEVAWGDGRAEGMVSVPARLDLRQALMIHSCPEITAWLPTRLVLLCLSFPSESQLGHPGPR